MKMSGFCCLLLIPPSSLWELCETPAGVLQGRVEKPFLFFHTSGSFHQAAAPFFLFLVLFSFFTLPIPIGVGFHDPATTGVAPGIAFKRAPQDLACRVITTQDMGSVMNTDRLVQMFTNQHSASRHTEAECLLRDL